MEISTTRSSSRCPARSTLACTSPLFWGQLAVSLVVAFVITTPVNHWLIARGKGHAVVHQLHHSDHADHAHH